MDFSYYTQEYPKILDLWTIFMASIQMSTWDTLKFAFHHDLLMSSMVGVSQGTGATHPSGKQKKKHDNTHKTKQYELPQ